MILTNINNALQDVRNPETKFLNRIHEKLNENNYTNASVIPTLTLDLVELNSLKPQTNLINIGDGFFYTTFLQGQNFLPRPITNYKTNSIKDINLALNVFVDAPDTGGYTPPVGITDFVIDFYVSLHILAISDGNLFSSRINGGVVNSRALTIPFRLNISALNPLRFTITNSARSFRLSNYIESRGWLNGQPDFTTNPTRITQSQYNQLLNQDNMLLTMFGFDLGQFNALSASNKLLFDDFFNNGIGSFPNTTQLFGFGVQATINYFGLLASYVPINE